MITKQKITFLVIAIGIVCGFSVVSLSRSVSAQTTIPSACVSDPDGERCKHCTDGVLGDQAEGCNLVQPTGEDRNACEPGDDGCCGGVKTSIISGDLCGGTEDGTESGTIYKLLIGVLNILTAGIGIAAVGGIAYGALLYTTAENKPDQTKKAIGIITNVVIGIVAYGLMFVLLNFLIPGGIFS